MPKGRAYLPLHLTKAERRSPKLQAKLSRCIRAVEKKVCPKSAKKAGRYDYTKCKKGNPVRICRASLTLRTIKMVGFSGSVSA